MPIIENLVVEEYGAFVGKKQGRVVVTVKDKIVAEAPLLHLQTIVVASNGVSVSSDVLAACCEEGIPIHFVDSRGRAYASVYSAGLTGTVRTRRAQLKAYDEKIALTLARAVARAKLQNQAGLLRYAAKYRQESAPEVYAILRDAMTEVLVKADEALRVLPEAAHIETLRESLLAVEGQGAQHYWRGFAALLPKNLEWPGRTGRGALDPVNSALNYGYGILYGQVERAIVLAGLDPYAGFVHADRPGKPSLVFDLVEPFRQPVVDRALLNFLNKGGEIERDDKGLLAEACRRGLAERVLDRLERPTEYHDKQFGLRQIIQMQARELATFLRGDRVEFEPYVARF
ncbi:CRISPR-associated endonuclease Cas1 [Candidatus Amarolinea dominans]|uniref:CRISPR-associated endonuclease Cas1 n=1 Tax=Candidatus Amarolinea dominans TaxID=3140696 RepID=UPI0031357F55|nr:CRISPR-associated endonuclease Cas1 [Anaerolineae bacterium]